MTQGNVEMQEDCSCHNSAQATILPEKKNKHYADFGHFGLLYSIPSIS